jgi:hypothetical protein
VYVSETWQSRRSDDDFDDSNVDYDDEKNNENDGNGDEFLSAWTRHGQNWSRICWATYQHPVLQPIFNRQPLIWSIRRGKTLLAVACSG